MEVGPVQLRNEKTALVLSAGGMYAAYQAGVWKAIAPAFQPDMVIGVSAGILNAWIIASGCPPDELIARWTDHAVAEWLSFRRIIVPWRSVFDAACFEAHAQELFSTFCPRIPVGVVAVDLLRLRSRLFTNSEITWRHLAASCSIPLLLPPQRIDGRLYVDGGILNALPLWAAREMGASRVIAIDAMPAVSSAVLRASAGTFHRLKPHERQPVAGMEVIRIAPSSPVARLHEMVRWKPDSIRRLIDLGYRDGESFTMRLYDELPDLSPERRSPPALPDSSARFGNG
jgi:NTE family protein